MAGNLPVGQTNEGEEDLEEDADTIGELGFMGPPPRMP